MKKSCSFSLLSSHVIFLELQAMVVPKSSLPTSNSFACFALWLVVVLMLLLIHGVVMIFIHRFVTTFFHQIFFFFAYKLVGKIFSYLYPLYFKCHMSLLDDMLLTTVRLFLLSKRWHFIFPLYSPNAPVHVIIKLNFIQTS